MARPLALLLFLLLCLTGFHSTLASAQADFPVRPITLIIPFAAGGPTDMVGRIVAERMSGVLGQQIVVENIIGSGGTTAATRAMRSAADGYTIMLGHMGTHGAAVALYPKLPYDPSSDFTPIGIVAVMPVLLLSKKDLPARDLGEFIAYVKQHEAGLVMAHAGMGSVAHVTCELFNSLVGIRPKTTAFQGTGPAMTALVAGKVDYMCDQIVTVVPQLKAKAVQAYVVGTPRRNAALPEIPTAVEAGLPKFEVSSWNALFAPKNAAAPVVAKLKDALARTLADPAVQSKLANLGAEIPDEANRSPEALSALVKTEVARWRPILQPIEGTN